MTTNLLAANAYAALGRITGGAGAAPVAPSTGLAPSGGGFSAMVSDAIGSVAEMGANADAKTQGLAQGRTDLVDVVTAVTESELALETLVSVRDRVISAYEEIMRMPI